VNAIAEQAASTWCGSTATSRRTTRTASTAGDQALRLRGEEDIAAAERHRSISSLLDTPSESFGGTGKIHDWSLAASAC
jgi:phosphoribosylanthranilate isomerase